VNSRFVTTRRLVPKRTKNKEQKTRIAYESETPEKAAAASSSDDLSTLLNKDKENKGKKIVFSTPQRMLSLTNSRKSTSSTRKLTIVPPNLGTITEESFLNENKNTNNKSFDEKNRLNTSKKKLFEKKNDESDGNSLIKNSEKNQEASLQPSPSSKLPQYPNTRSKSLSPQLENPTTSVASRTRQSGKIRQTIGIHESKSDLNLNSRRLSLRIKNKSAHNTSVKNQKSPFKNVNLDDSRWTKVNEELEIMFDSDNDDEEEGNEVEIMDQSEEVEEEMVADVSELGELMIVESDHNDELMEQQTQKSPNLPSSAQQPKTVMMNPIILVEKLHIKQVVNPMSDEVMQVQNVELANDSNGTDYYSNRSRENSNAESVNSVRIDSTICDQIQVTEAGQYDQQIQQHSSQTTTTTTNKHTSRNAKIDKKKENTSFSSTPLSNNEFFDFITDNLVSTKKKNTTVRGQDENEVVDASVISQNDTNLVDKLLDFILEKNI
jgi:hypothetical protein